MDAMVVKQRVLSDDSDKTNEPQLKEEKLLTNKPS